MIVSLLFGILVSAQTIPVIGLADLETRFANGGDTVYVVNFWATWCKPCIAELPAFDKLDRSWRTTPLKVLLVSLDDPEDANDVVGPFLKRKGLGVESVLLDEPKPHEWIDRIDESWSGAIPATLLVEPASNRRQFHERDFTYDELMETVNVFTKAKQ